MQGFNKMERIIDDYVFTQLTSPKVSDALVIHNPPFATCKSPVLLQSRKTLDDHIAYIRDNELKKAVIVADDISFLRNCPSLECLWIIPALSACDFDYSPLYDLPNIRHLKCETVYGYKEDRIAHVDYSRLPRLQSLAVCNTQGHHHIESAKSLKVLFFERVFP